VADKTGLTAGLSKALASERLLVHDRGRVLADLACAIAGGGEAVGDFRVIGDQDELFGPAASVPACWRTLNEIAAGRERSLGDPWNPGHPARQPGHCHQPALKSRSPTWPPPQSPSPIRPRQSSRLG